MSQGMYCTGKRVKFPQMCYQKNFQIGQNFRKMGCKSTFRQDVALYTGLGSDFRKMQSVVELKLTQAVFKFGIRRVDQIFYLCRYGSNGDSWFSNSSECLAMEFTNLDQIHIPTHSNALAFLGLGMLHCTTLSIQKAISPRLDLPPSQRKRVPPVFLANLDSESENELQSSQFKQKSWILSNK